MITNPARKGDATNTRGLGGVTAICLTGYRGTMRKLRYKQIARHR